MQIFVETPQGKLIALDVQGTDHVAKIKTLIKEDVDIPLEKMALVIKTLTDAIHLEDHRSLDFYEIEDWYILQVVETVQVRVRTVSGDLITSLQVSPLDNARNVLYKALLVGRKPDLKFNELLFRSTLLMGDKALCHFHPMSHYNVQNGSELTLVIHSEIGWTQD